MPVLATPSPTVFPLTHHSNQEPPCFQETHASATEPRHMWLLLLHFQAAGYLPPVISHPCISSPTHDLPPTYQISHPCIRSPTHASALPFLGLVPWHRVPFCHNPYLNLRLHIHYRRESRCYESETALQPPHHNTCQVHHSMSNTVEDYREGHDSLGVREEGKVPQWGWYPERVQEGRFCQAETGVGRTCNRAQRHKNIVFREKQKFNVAASWTLG